jgi:hypothetical protein
MRAMSVFSMTRSFAKSALAPVLWIQGNFNTLLLLFASHVTENVKSSKFVQMME